jgi:hypothetical protein
MPPKTKPTKGRRKVIWVLLPALILFLGVWHEYGIWPTIDTLRLRRELKDVTKITLDETLYKGELSVLEGKEAQDFIQSILFTSPWNLHRVSFVTVFHSHDINCKFYQGSKLVSTITFEQPYNEVYRATWNESRYVLYQNSGRHIRKVAFKKLDERYK